MLARPLPTPIPLPNCVNYFYSHHNPGRGLHLARWDHDPEGNFTSIVTMVPPVTIEDDDWWRSQHQTRPASWMPLRMQQWIAENTKGLWFYEVIYQSNGRKYGTTIPMFVVVFEHANEAILFKLRWG